MPSHFPLPEPSYELVLGKWEVNSRGWLELKHFFYHFPVPPPFLFSAPGMWGGETAHAYAVPTHLDLLSPASRAYLIIHQDSLNACRVQGAVLSILSWTSLGAHWKLVEIFKIFPQLLRSSI